MRDRGPLTLRERLEVEAALEGAFAPLRSRRSSVGPTRVRAAVRWRRADAEAAVPWTAALSRISELGIAVGMCAAVFALYLTPAPVPRAPAAVYDVVDDVLVRRTIWAVKTPAGGRLEPRRVGSVEYRLDPSTSLSGWIGPEPAAGEARAAFASLR